MLAILGLIPTVLTFFTGLGNTASSISKDIRDLQIAKEQTKSNERLKEIDAEIAALHARKDVLVANAGNRFYGLVTFMLAIGPATYVFKYYLIDKVIGSLAGCRGEAAKAIEACQVFAMDPISTEMTVVLTAVLAFFLLKR